MVRRISGSTSARSCPKHANRSAGSARMSDGTSQIDAFVILSDTTCIIGRHFLRRSENRSLVGEVANVAALILGNLKKDVLKPLVVLASHDLRVSPLHGGQNEVGRAHLRQTTLGRKDKLSPTIARVRPPLHVPQTFQLVDKCPYVL